jgi:hypothetical protein
MLERQFGLFVDEPACHHEVTGHPFGAVCFKCLDFMLRGPVQFLPRDVLVNLRGTLPVRAVGAAEVPCVGNPHRSVLSLVPAELTGSGFTAVKASRCPVRALTKGLTATVPAAEAAALTITLTTRTITKRLTITIARSERLTVTVTGSERLTVTVPGSERLTVTVPAAKRLTVTVPAAKRLTITLTGTKRLTVTVPAAEAAALSITLTTRTITKRPTITVAGTKATALTITLTTRTITKRLTITITRSERLTLAVTFAARTITKRLTSALAITILAGTESSRVATRITGSPERAVGTSPAEVPAVFAAAVSALVLSHFGVLL